MFSSILRDIKHDYLKSYFRVITFESPATLVYKNLII